MLSETISNTARIRCPTRRWQRLSIHCNSVRSIN